eukprot:6452761-Pyramimonas_sp.AAC.1
MREKERGRERARERERERERIWDPADPPETGSPTPLERVSRDLQASGSPCQVVRPCRRRSQETPKTIQDGLQRPRTPARRSKTAQRSPPRGIRTANMVDSPLVSV